MLICTNGIGVAGSVPNSHPLSVAFPRGEKAFKIHWTTVRLPSSATTHIPVLAGGYYDLHQRAVREDIQTDEGEGLPGLVSHQLLHPQPQDRQERSGGADVGEQEVHLISDDALPRVDAVRQGQAGGHFPGVHKGHTEVGKGS